MILPWISVLILEIFHELKLKSVVWERYIKSVEVVTLSNFNY